MRHLSAKPYTTGAGGKTRTISKAEPVLHEVYNDSSLKWGLKRVRRSSTVTKHDWKTASGRVNIFRYFMYHGVSVLSFERSIEFLLCNLANSSNSSRPVCDLWEVSSTMALQRLILTTNLETARRRTKSMSLAFKFKFKFWSQAIELFHIHDSGIKTQTREANKDRKFRWATVYNVLIRCV